MTSLQSAKDDLSQQLTDSQKAAAASQKKADDLEKTNESPPLPATARTDMHE